MPDFAEEFFHEPPTEEEVARERSRQVREQRKDEFLLRILDDPAGRAFVWDHLTSCHLFENGFVAGVPDATAFTLGERNVGLKLLAQIMRVAPRAYVVMVEENPG